MSTAPNAAATYGMLRERPSAFSAFGAGGTCALRAGSTSVAKEESPSSSGVGGNACAVGLCSFSVGCPMIVEGNGRRTACHAEDARGDDFRTKVSLRED